MSQITDLLKGINFKIDRLMQNKGYLRILLLVGGCFQSETMTLLNLTIDNHLCRGRIHHRNQNLAFLVCKISLKRGRKATLRKFFRKIRFRGRSIENISIDMTLIFLSRRRLNDRARQPDKNSEKVYKKMRRRKKQNSIQKQQT